MPTSIEKVTVEWEAKLDGFQREYAKIKDLPQQQANLALKSLDRQVKAEEKAYRARISRIKEIDRAERQAAKAAETAAEGPREKWEAFEKVAQGVGGAFGELAGMASDLGEGLGGIAGKTGLAVAGAAALAFGAYKAAEAMVALHASVSEAADRLTQLETLTGLNIVDEVAIEKIDDWSRAVQTATVQADRLKVEIASGMAPEVTRLTLAWVGLTEAFREHREAGDKAAESTESWSTALSEAVNASLPAADDIAFVNEVIDTLADKGREVEASLAATTEQIERIHAATATWGDLLADMQVDQGKMTQGQRWLREELERINAAYDESRDALEDAGKATGEALAQLARERDELIRNAAAQAARRDEVKETARATGQLTEAQRAQAEAERILADATKALLTEEQRKELAYWSQMEALDALERQGANAATVEAARNAVTLASIQEVEAEQQEAAEKRASTLERIRAIHQATAEAEFGAELKTAEAIRQATTEYEAKRNELVALQEQHKLDPEIQEAINAELLELDAAHKAEMLELEAQHQEALNELRARTHAAELTRIAQQVEHWAGGAAKVAESIAKAAGNTLAWFGDLEAEEKAALKRMRKAETEAEKERAEEDLERVRRKRRTAREIAKIGQTAALVAWATDKAAGVAEATISGIEAVAEASPNPVAMAAAGIFAAAQVAAIAAQPPPKFQGPQFHTGFAPYSPGPDEYGATLVKGESVLNTRATQTVGPEVVDALNRGLPAPMQAGPNYLVIGDDVLELLADRVTRTRAFEKRTPRTGPRGHR